MAINVGNGLMLYSPPDAARTIGMKLATLNYWAREGFITPSIESARNKSKIRFYSFQDLVALKVAIRLRERGISLQALRRVVEYLQSKADITSPFTDCRLMIVGDDVVEYDEAIAVSALRNPGQGILNITVVEVADAVRELGEATAVAA